MLLKYSRLKHILLKKYLNERTYIIITGVVETTIAIDDTKILIDRKKIIFSNGEYQNFIINLDSIEEIKIINEWHIVFKYKNINVIVQQ